MNARRKIVAALSEDSYGGIATPSDVDHAEQLVDAHRAEVLAEDRAMPLVVSRFDTATEPAPEEDQVLTVCCIAEDGRPVALLLDLETRAKVARWLAPPSEVDGDVPRRSHLLADISKGGRWKTGRVCRWYEDHGYTGLGARTARRDLAVLRDSGFLVQHDEEGVRYFTAARDGGRRG
ncbi:hypothetical protein [Streptomyces fumanus]|uniref:Uncharacterized protein n=1 Tax=Streptomyces fumanus TaxID=67302 RepID=A0A919A3U6_9ACTN|nr:hypothetical protein [Streptomyces fumanus]GHE84781.1 hypothetical protein GCM10018772_04830 [Streptomyces fumanus]